MNLLWKSMIIVFLFLVGTAFLFISHAERGDNLVALVAWNNDHPKEPTKRERGMLGLPINGQVRTKGLPVGPWGGEHINLEVTEQGATIEYDCAHATIEQRIALDRRGRFDVAGMQIQERGGPTRQGAESGYAVRFAGQVNGKKMTLTVTNSLTKESLGTFILVHGRQSKLFKCK